MTFQVMKAKTYEAKRVTDWSSLVVEPKLNGIRMVGKFTLINATFFSINGRVLDMFDTLFDPLGSVLHRLITRWGQVMVDGEVLSADGKFNTISGAIHKKNHTEVGAQFHLFFAMPWKQFRLGGDSETQGKRLDTLEKLGAFEMGRGSVHRVPSTFVTADSMIEAASDAFVEEGYEGAMVKQLHTPYGARRSHDWMKLKAEETYDVKVIGMKEGKGKYVGTLGALVVRYKQKEIDVSGMTDAQRAKWWSNRRSIMGKTVEIKFQHETASGSIRHPRFVRTRPDKDR